MIPLNKKEIMEANEVLQRGHQNSSTSKMVKLNIFVPRMWIVWVDKMVEKYRYPNRSEAFRYMIRYYFDTFQIDYEQSK